MAAFLNSTKSVGENAIAAPETYLDNSRALMKMMSQTGKLRNSRDIIALGGIGDTRSGIQFAL